MPITSPYTPSPLKARTLLQRVQIVMLYNQLLWEAAFQFPQQGKQ